MYRTFAFLCKNPSLTTEEFIDYYENHQVPLVISLSGDKLPKVYKRRYLQHPGWVQAKEGAAQVDFDVVVELAFEDLEARKAWMAELSKNGGGEKIPVDEEKFLERTRTWANVIEEYVTKG